MKRQLFTLLAGCIYVLDPLVGDQFCLSRISLILRVLDILVIRFLWIHVVNALLHKSFSDPYRSRYSLPYSHAFVLEDTTRSWTQGSTLVVAKRGNILLFLHSRFRNNTLVNINSTLSVFLTLSLLGYLKTRICWGGV